ncbi:MAG TPA: FkbM family methyltransferase [Chthoniobacterales bacterium]|jgi:FkbM family methyltransferase
MIAQQISNLELFLRRAKVGEEVRSAFGRSKRWLTRWWDPAVSREIANVTLSLPLSHPLPINLEIFPLYDRQITPLVASLRKKYPDLRMIDVGANIGDTAALAKAETDIPVLCIEGNPRILPYLKRNLSRLGTIQLAETFVGMENGAVAFEIEHTPGSASIRRNRNADHSLPLATMQTILKKFPEFADAKFLKVDTDGFDGTVLRSARDYLTRTQPVLLFEVDPKLLGQQGEDAHALLDFLVSLNYEQFMIYDNFGNFLISLDRDQQDGFRDLVSYHLNSIQSLYWDVIAFASIDRDVHDKFRISERNRCVIRRLP